MAQITRVTQDSLTKADHYRAQVNVSPLYVAVGYNAIQAYYGPARAGRIRNMLAPEYEYIIGAEFAIAMIGDDKFSNWLGKTFLPEYIDNDLHETVQTAWLRWAAR